jgi:FtsH-binding integral membrane protein
MSDFDRYTTARYRTGTQAGVTAIDEGLRAYMLGVYNYMTLGLGITGLAAIGINKLAVASTSGEAAARAGNLMLTSFGVMLYTSPLRWLIMLAPLAFVFYFSFRLDRMSTQSAKIVFFLFAAAMGVSLSSILLVFSGTSIARAFFATAAAFGALSLYGYTTRRDLSAFGSFFVMGLFGLVIASLINVFLQSSAMQWALSIISILVFSGLTAWDTQAIKEEYYAGDHPDIAVKKSIYGALRLYLDFINIFQSLLYLMRGQE